MAKVLISIDDRVLAALAKAQEDIGSGHSRSAVVTAIVRQWLISKGYLKP